MKGTRIDGGVTVLVEDASRDSLFAKKKNILNAKRSEKFSAMIDMSDYEYS